MAEGGVLIEIEASACGMDNGDYQYVGILSHCSLKMHTGGSCGKIHPFFDDSLMKG